MSPVDADSAPFQVKVDSVTQVADGVLELTLVDPGGTLLRGWSAGAHVDLRLPAVLAGEVEHRDSILSDSEKAANDTMMICCSRGLGHGLVIDA
jgi:ferredoxin-NADP reductase